VTSKARILVVEADINARDFLTIHLESHGYLFAFAESGHDAMQQISSFKPDLILLEIDLPDLDGIEIIRRIRSLSKIPIIVVSVRSTDKDKVLALDEGADDYLTKPFSVEELLARIRVTWRRIQDGTSFQGNAEHSFRNGPLDIDYLSRSVKIEGNEIHLTPIEYKLLTLLAKNTGKVLTHNYILKEVWQNYLPNDTPSLRVFMATLRKKVDSTSQPTKMIQTHVGVGYRMIRLEDDIFNLT